MVACPLRRQAAGWVCVSDSNGLKSWLVLQNSKPCLRSTTQAISLFFTRCATSDNVRYVQQDLQYSTGKTTFRQEQSKNCRSFFWKYFSAHLSHFHNSNQIAKKAEHCRRITGRTAREKTPNPHRRAERIRTGKRPAFSRRRAYRLQFPGGCLIGTLLKREIAASAKSDVLSFREGHTDFTPAALGLFSWLG